MDTAQQATIINVGNNNELLKIARAREREKAILNRQFDNLYAKEGRKEGTDSIGK